MNDKANSVYGLDKIPDSELLKASRKEIGALKSEVEFLEAEVLRLKSELNTKAGFKLSKAEKIKIRTESRVEDLTKGNKKLATENKKLKKDNNDLIYRIVQIQKKV